MPTKIRLQRRGKKGQAFYHIVIADGRAPRDGKFIEKIGTYDPKPTPAIIDLNFERALYWYQVGAQPTDTVRAILRYKGILYKNHLEIGVKKGAMTQEQADVKFNEWLKGKEDKIEQKRKNVELGIKEAKKERLAEEKKINEERAAKYAEMRAAEAKAKEEELLAKAAEAKAAMEEAEAKAAGMDTEANEEAAEAAEESAE
jgi:small subunit ribosomal protein S16